MTEKIKAIVVDLDGTLACGAQRLHLMPPPEQRGDPLAWEPFHMACGGDSIIHDVKGLVLAMNAAGYEIIYVSYRSESTREITLDWLSMCCVLFPSQQLFLRPGDRDTPAGEYKVNIVTELQSCGYEIAFALDDDPDVCHAFRMADIPAYQVRDWKKPMPSEAVELPGYTPGTKAMAEKATKPLGTTADMTVRHEKAFFVSMVCVLPDGAREFATRKMLLMMEGIGPVQEIGAGEVALDLMAAEEWLEWNLDSICGFGGLLRETPSALISRGIMIYPEEGHLLLSPDITEGPGVLRYTIKSDV